MKCFGCKASPTSQDVTLRPSQPLEGKATSAPAKPGSTPETQLFPLVRSIAEHVLVTLENLAQLSDPEQLLQPLVQID